MRRQIQKVLLRLISKSILPPQKIKSIAFSPSACFFCSISGFDCYFLACIQVSQEAGKFVVIHTVKGFSIIPWRSVWQPTPLLIGYENGTVVFWDLKSKRAELRVYYDEAIHSIDWHHEGKQFMCSHSDGSLTLWNLKSPTRPFQTTVPHGKIYAFKRNEPFIIFSGGLSYDKACRRPSLTIMHGKAITVLEMDHPIVEFLTLCETPYPNEFQEPYAVAVLLEKDLIVVDLTQSNFPIFENPYPMDIHESPVTCTAYFADCPPDLILVLYSIGVKHKKQGYSNKEWPISGGAWNLGTQTYPEIIITGHADGSIKFWDASAITLQMLYKLKTSKVFEKQKVGEGKQTCEIVEEDPYAIQMIYWCPESRIFCVSGVSAYVIIYKFSRHEITTEIVSLEVRLQYDIEDIITPEPETSPPFPDLSSQLPSRSLSGSTTTVASEGVTKDSIPCLKVAFGNCNGLAVVDFIQKTVLLSMGTIDLYRSSDIYQRQPRSPRKNKQFILVKKKKKKKKLVELNGLQIDMHLQYYILHYTVSNIFSCMQIFVLPKYLLSCSSHEKFADLSAILFITHPLPPKRVQPKLFLKIHTLKYNSYLHLQMNFLLPIKTLLLSQCVAFTTLISETLGKISLPIVNLSCYHQSALHQFLNLKCLQCP
ncbi:hypothetical protein FD754_005551 [Muntiacus muntjak]|uniref:Lethal giant larvae homologue 2 domain-containing protein n=1 Tax=Muntiacus muntjak TaxID=9888 RepID=A0A5N3WKZ3_MUNMU|nr:hypothetical protein FD754_005551 [Muntiacus muntjak]